MLISFRTRADARIFHAKRQSKNLPGKIVDHGKDAKQDGKHITRYAVSLR